MICKALILLCAVAIHTGYACMTTDPNGGGGTTGATAASNPPDTTPAPDTTAAPTEATTAGATTGNPEDKLKKQCSAVGADFGSKKDDGYADSIGKNGFEEKGSNSRAGNKGTGVPGSYNKKGRYAAAKLAPGESAKLISKDIPDDAKFDKDQYLVVNNYEATDGITLYGCINDETNCNPLSDKAVTSESLNWRKKSIKMGPDTKKVTLLAKNEGDNYGAVGVDSVGISDTDNGADKCNNVK